MLVLLALLACKGPEETPADAQTGPEAPAPSGVLPLAASPKNLLMISIDTLRRDAFARYGGSGALSFLDGVIAEGFALDAHTACSNWTFHSTTCTLRGAHPVDWGFAPAFSVDETVDDVPEGTPFLATWLGDGGFDHSLLVSTNALLSNAHGNAQGYDEVLLAPNLGFTPAADAAAEGVAAFDARLAQGDVERWFLHLHFMEPHQPYDPPAEYLDGLDALPPISFDLTTKTGHTAAALAVAEGSVSPEEAEAIEQHMRLRYEGELAWLDSQLAGVWADLDGRGWLDDTLVVLWTDHGEQFFERGYQTHAWTLYAEETDGLAAFWARGMDSGSWTQPTSGIDLVPTVLDALGVPIPGEVDGLVAGTAPADRPVFSDTSAKVGTFQAVRVGDQKLHFSWTTPEDWPAWGQHGHGVHVYDLAADPAEQTDLFDASDATTQALWETLLPRVEETQALYGGTVAWPDGLAQP